MVAGDGLFFRWFVAMSANAIPSVSIIIPTYKEAENLPLLIPQIAAALGQRGWNWEVIVVDDNSPDATPKILNELSSRFAQLRSLIRTQ